MTKPTISLQELRARIGDRAKSAATHRFWGLHVHIKKFDTLEEAYRLAKANHGTSGADGVTFEDIERDGQEAFIKRLVTELNDGTYRAQPYRKVEIPKGNGKTRTISIAAIRDRVVQGAMKLILEPIFEADFSDSSLGARPERGAHEAVDRVQQALRQGKHYVVDVDLAAFFDNISHCALMAKIAKRVKDPAVLAMIKWFLKGAGKRGVPQGSPLSPLLANVALTDLDHALDRGQGVITYVRYLDDMVVLAHPIPKGRRWADRALQRIRQEAGDVGVQVNEEKTRIVEVKVGGSIFSFLGFDFRWVRSRKTGRCYAHTTPKPQKVTGLQSRIREVLRRNRHLEVADAVVLLNPILRGWVNYFKIGNSTEAFGKVRNYTELKVRRFAARQRKRHGFGWKRWSNQVVYGRWGLYDAYRVRYMSQMKVAPASKGIINPMR